MTEGNDQKRLQVARWAVVGAFALVALLMGTVAFAGVALPGQPATYADLPVVRIASTSSSPTAVAAGPGTTGGDPSSPARFGTTAAAGTTASSGKSGTVTSSATSPSGGASTTSKGNTPDKRRTEPAKHAEAKKREVVTPDVRVEESSEHQSDTNH